MSGTVKYDRGSLNVQIQQVRKNLITKKLLVSVIINDIFFVFKMLLVYYKVSQIESLAIVNILQK